MKRIDKMMDQQIAFQNWYNEEQKWIEESSKSDYTAIAGFSSIIQAFDKYYNQIDNYYYSYYGCMYSANTYFKNKCHGSYITSCTAIINVVDSIEFYVKNLEKYIKAIIVAKKQIKYSQEAIDFLNRPIDQLRNVFKQYKYINGQLSQDSPYYYPVREVKRNLFFEEFEPPNEKLFPAFQETAMDSGWDEANLYSCMHLGQNKVTESNCECKRIADVMGSWGIYQKICYSKNESAIRTLNTYIQNANTNIQDNLTMYNGTPFVVPPNVKIGCCSLELYCPKGDCDVTQFCKIKISSNSLVNAEQVPKTTDKNTGPIMIPGQKELNETSPLCWNVENSKNPNQCMAGWLLFTDGNCYAPEGVINSGSPYNKQELASYTNDELYYYFNKFEINQPVSCPAPKLTPKEIKVIKTNAQNKASNKEAIVKNSVFTFPTVSTDNELSNTNLSDKNESEKNNLERQEQYQPIANIENNSVSSTSNIQDSKVLSKKSDTSSDSESSKSILNLTNIIIILTILALISSSLSFFSMKK